MDGDAYTRLTSEAAKKYRKQLKEMVEG